jgi:signal transduction histidine kinase/HPt (histidine-containing phosphotransfer) domain-containing protein/ActR/RegA family two-component response regulator
MPPQPIPAIQAAPPGLGTRPLWLLYTCTCLIIVVLIMADAAVSLHLRETALRGTETNLRNISLALAEQADRAVQGVDLVLSSTAEFVSTEQVEDAADFRRRMADRRVHELLQQKVVGLPYINAVTMIAANGDLINFSRYWPIPPVNVADRDYFQKMRDDPALQRFFSQPVRNRGDNTWTIYLAHRVPVRDGGFAGLLLGAIDLKYFEDFYRSVSLGEGTAISLIRLDGALLARYPPADAIGSVFPLGGRRALGGGTTGVIRDVSPVDGTFRLKAASKLTNFPLFVLVTQTQATALNGWRSVALVLGLVTAGCDGAILIAALAVGRWWRQQQMLGRTRAEYAEAERARAVAEAALARERERHAEDASKAKSGFLAMMSHEIRTPLNAVLGLAGSLLDASLPPAQRDVVKAIRASGDSLLRILNDILDYSKLDAGRMTFEAAPFSPATLTQNAISILGPRARAKGLTIVAETDPALPAGLLGDAGRIRQVLLNLVSNAVKFTDAGAVTIRARCLGREGDATTVEWSVQDTGIGIAPDRIGSLFREFVQADSSISRRFGGSGLGLAISKQLTEQMGGTIGVESVAGAGTMFRMRLTLPIAEAPADAPPAPVDATRALQARLGMLGRPLRILFAEDNPTNQFVALQMLKTLPVQVDVVGDGLEAVDAASRLAYDMIFMDMRMPEMDGLAATRLIRQRGGTLAHVPIVALTANAFPEDVKACFDAGMNQFVTKPVSKDVLIAAILRGLSPAAAPSAAPVGTPPGDGVADGPVAFDAAALHALGEDIGHDGVAEMLEVFQRETRARLRRMMAPGVSSATLMREAHTLKGAAGTVCAPLLHRRAEVIEARLRAGAPIEPGDLASLGRAFQAFIDAVEAIGVTAPAAV